MCTPKWTIQQFPQPFLIRHAGAKAVWELCVDFCNFFWTCGPSVDDVEQPDGPITAWSPFTSVMNAGWYRWYLVPNVANTSTKLK